VCTPAVCGDGRRGGDEECDDGNADDDICDANCEWVLMEVLLAVDATSDSVAMLDPNTGDYLGDFLPPAAGQAWTFSTPIEALQGPDMDIYVSDQLTDNVQRFGIDGTYKGVFASAGLDNVRGIAFLGNDLLVSNSNPRFVRRFDSTGAPLPDYITDDSDPFDVLVLDDGSVLVSVINQTQGVRLFAPGVTTTYTQLVNVSFPQQIARAPNGNFVVAAFSNNNYTEFTPTGTVVRTFSASSPRGIYVLPNGNWLVAAGASAIGLAVVDPATGAVLNQVRTGTSWRYINKAFVSPSLLAGN